MSGQKYVIDEYERFQKNQGCLYNKYNNRNIYICIEKLNKNNNFFFG